MTTISKRKVLNGLGHLGKTRKKRNLIGNSSGLDLSKLATPNILSVFSPLNCNPMNFRPASSAFFLRKRIHQIIWLIVFAPLVGCELGSDDGETETTKLFQRISPGQSGVSFQNNVVQTADMNFFTNQHVLNGGGVAVGDMNNDGLPDLYFSSNQNSNHLYMNKGELKFEEVAEVAGVTGNSYWNTGVSIVDVNADGWNDIYLCHAGNFLNEPEKLQNELFINNGDADKNNGVPTFTERAVEFGLAGFSRSVHAAFLDYDNDNDLDVYVLNHPYNFWLPIDMRIEVEKRLPEEDSDRLYRNDGNGKFTDVTEEAGVKNWAFGLSASVGDLNNDGWMDIYVANDYSEKDECLINNQDGSFSKTIDSMFFHISNFSMGSDIADFNNDGLADVVVVDMMAEDNRRKKINMSAMKPEVFWDNVALGRHYQYMQNTLQLNNGNGTFSDVAELSGVAFTDWSWSAIFADLDNDGWKDLFISNGLGKDIRNTDANRALLGKEVMELRKDFQQHIDKLPSEPIDNYVFRNNGNLTFEKKTLEWGVSYSGFSNGAALADLDRDGDLDLVLNNLNDTASIFENRVQASNYLQLLPIGPEGNRAGVGMIAEVYAENAKQSQHVSISRGFLSCGENLLHFGIPHEKVDSVLISWPDGKFQVILNPPLNKVWNVRYAEAVSRIKGKKQHQGYFEDITDETGIDFVHSETLFNDYAEQVLLPHKYSQFGPALAVADVNSDGLDDVFFGGAAGQASKLYLQTTDGNFKVKNIPDFSKHSGYEDVEALFFDLDGDGDNDLYVGSGSNEWPVNDPYYQDRIYLNDGLGGFRYDPLRLPTIVVSTGCVAANDFDHDGDMDLFVGGRIIPGKYPTPASGFLLQNNDGYFQDITKKLCPEMNTLGLVTDAVWMDLDKDGNSELIVSAEWSPIRVFKNYGNRFEEISDKAGTSGNSGWWYSLTVADLDNDGDEDLLAGNLGLNTKYQGTIDRPFEVYHYDFDDNGHGDIVLAYPQDGDVFPVRGRSCSSEQIPMLKKKFPTYEEFGSATLQTVYGNALDSALHYQANWMSSSVLMNQGDGTLKFKSLPIQAQLSSINGIVVLDVNSDAAKDVVVAGNMYHAETETCRHDASIGLLLMGDGNGGLEPADYAFSGLEILGDTKGIQKIELNGGLALIAARNAQAPLVIKLK